jgi:hypothetical protein
MPRSVSQVQARKLVTFQMHRLRRSEVGSSFQKAFIQSQRGLEIRGAIGRQVLMGSFEPGGYHLWRVDPYPLSEGD